MPHQTLAAHAPVFHPDAPRIIEAMIRGKWLVGYAEIDGVDRVLRQMSQRFSRENPMAEGVEALREAHAELAAIFEDLWPEMITEFGLHRSKFIGKV